MCLMRNFLVLSGVALAAATMACRPQGQDGAANGTENAVSPIDRLPVSEAPLDRAALLMAAANAASAAALGQPDKEQRRLLDGKRFEVRIRFGCTADRQLRDAPPTFEVKFDEVDRMLRIRAAPDLNREDPRIASIGDESVEAVEGFWLRRPWLLAEGCPPPPRTAESKVETAGAATASAATDPAPAPAIPAPRQMIGIAEFFTEARSRTARRDDRAYEVAKALGGIERPSEIGYNLVLSGRLRQLPSGQVISCLATGPDEPPQCVISAQFDRVRIESPTSREILAEWSS